MPASPRTGIVVALAVAAAVIAADVAGIWYLRARTADLQALGELAQIRSALEVFRAENSYYPRAVEPVLLSDAYAGTQKLCTDGFKRITDACARTIMARLPVEHASSFTYASAADGADYHISLSTRTTLRVFGIPAGALCATASGVTAGSCN